MPPQTQAHADLTEEDTLTFLIYGTALGPMPHLTEEDTLTFLIYGTALGPMPPQTQAPAPSDPSPADDSPGVIRRTVARGNDLRFCCRCCDHSVQRCGGGSQQRQGNTDLNRRCFEFRACRNTHMRLITCFKRPAQDDQGGEKPRLEGSDKVNST